MTALAPVVPLVPLAPAAPAAALAALAPLLSLTGITVSRPENAPGARNARLEAIDLAVAPGEQLAIIGPSGAGKTTLLEVMALALAPDHGALMAFDQAPWEITATARHRLRAHVAYAPQTPPLPPRQRVVTAVLAARLPHWSLLQALRSLWAPQDVQTVADLLASLGLADKLWQATDRLSGGERQRVMLARMLLAQARLMLLDEPLAALDPARAEATLELMCTAARKRGQALVCGLHQVDLALQCFPRIVGLRDGRILFDVAREAVEQVMLDELYGAPTASAQAMAVGAQENVTAQTLAFEARGR